MKIANIILTVLFVLFALVQINDVDPLKWVLLYGVVALLFGLAAFGYYRRWFVIGVAAILLIEFFRLAPDFMDWIGMGMPTITGSMKATEPHVELTREFLGIFISMAALVFLYFQSLKKSVLTTKDQ